MTFSAWLMSLCGCLLPRRFWQCCFCLDLTRCGIACIRLRLNKCAYLLKPVSAVTPSITKELQPKVRCYTLFLFIPLQLPAPLLTGTDFQQHILGLGNIWETFRACTAHSASMCQSINFYSLLLSFLFFRVNTYRFTCILARSANFACKINE